MTRERDSGGLRRVFDRSKLEKGQLILINRGDLHPDPGQDRNHFDEEEMAKIRASMELRIEQGKVPNADPLQVAPRAEGGYTIFSGETRWRCAGDVNYNGDMECILRTGLDEDEYRDLMALANTGGSPLDLADRAKAAVRRIEKGQPRPHVMAVLGINDKSDLSHLERFAANAQPDVIAFAHEKRRKNVKWFNQLITLPEAYRKEVIDLAREGNLDNGYFRELVDKAAKGELEGVESVLETTNDEQIESKPVRKRRSSKATLEADKLKAIVSGHAGLRKLIKQRIPGQQGYMNASATDFVEAFLEAIDELAGQIDDDNLVSEGK